MNKEKFDIKADSSQIFCFNIDKKRLREWLPTRAWEPVLIRDTIDCRILADTSGAKILLIYLHSMESVRQSEQMLNQCRSFRAIAIVKPTLLDVPEITEFLATFFYAYQAFPVRAESLATILRQAQRMNVLSASTLDESSQSTHQKFPILGSSPAMQEVKDRVSKFSQTQAAVMISGESGTGKELAAKSIHELSDRANKRFVAVNVAALPDELVQSVLFGHEKGAFTGAIEKKVGIIESADGGTLFLDEIGDMPLQHQVSLLRFLQEGIVTRIGSTETLPVDVRIITATHVNLEEAIGKGDFREDLYYRLNVLNLHMPALRSREQDVAQLASHYLREYCLQQKKQGKAFESSAIAAMADHSWPGNVRELINRVQRAVIMSENVAITSEDMGLKAEYSFQRVTTLAEARARIETGLITTALHQTTNNMSACARILGISRVTLYKLIDKHEIPVHSVSS